MYDGVNILALIARAIGFLLRVLFEFLPAIAEETFWHFARRDFDGCDRRNPGWQPRSTVDRKNRVVVWPGGSQ